MLDVERVIEEAQRLILAPVPYVDKGRSMSGLDCTGVVIFLYRAGGVELPDIGAESRLDEAMRTYEPLFERVSDPEPGDVVIYPRDGRPHVGVALPGRRICHAVEGAGVVSTRMPVHPQCMRYRSEVVSDA